MDLWTVEQMAQALGMHPRTIRRYIREGRLVAHKVGGEWRIRKADAEAFTGGIAPQLHDQAAEEVAAFLSGAQHDVTRGIQVCSIIDVPADDAHVCTRISERLIQEMNEAHGQGHAKFQYFYLADRQVGRFILWGRPAWVGKLLQLIGKSTE